MREQNEEQEDAEKNDNFDPSVPLKKCDIYQQMFTQENGYFSSYNPDIIEETLISYLKTQGQNIKEELIKVNENKYKVKFTVASSLPA